MTREELRERCQKQVEAWEMWAKHNGKEPRSKIYEGHKLILELLEQEPVLKELYDHEYFLRKELEIKIAKLESILEKVSDQIEQKIEQEKCARLKYRYDEIDAVKAEQCTGCISAYHYVIACIGDAKAESEKK